MELFKSGLKTVLGHSEPSPEMSGAETVSPSFDPGCYYLTYLVIISQLINVTFYNGQQLKMIRGHRTPRHEYYLEMAFVEVYFMNQPLIC